MKDLKELGNSLEVIEKFLGKKIDLGEGKSTKPPTHGKEYNDEDESSSLGISRS